MADPELGQIVQQHNLAAVANERPPIVRHEQHLNFIELNEPGQNALMPENVGHWRLPGPPIADNAEIAGRETRVGRAVVEENQVLILFVTANKLTQQTQHDKLRASERLGNESGSSSLHGDVVGVIWEIRR